METSSVLTTEVTGSNPVGSTLPGTNHCLVARRGGLVSSLSLCWKLVTLHAIAVLIVLETTRNTGNYHEPYEI